MFQNPKDYLNLKNPQLFLKLMDFIPLNLITLNYFLIQKVLYNLSFINQINQNIILVQLFHLHHLDIHLYQFNTFVV